MTPYKNFQDKVRQSNKNPKQVKPPSTEGVIVSTSDRVLVAGKTGSGKTMLSMLMLYPLKRLIVVDSKDGLQDWELEEFDAKSVSKIKNNEPIRVRVVGDADALSCLRAGYESGDIVVYIDEVTAIIPPQSKPDQVFVDIWQRGRSRRVGAWAATQRPKGIPQFFISEAEHIFVFRLNLEGDRARVAEIAGKEVMNPVRDKYGFYYYDQDSGNVRYFSRVKI